MLYGVLAKHERKMPENFPNLTNLSSLSNVKLPRYEQVRWYIQNLLTEHKWDKDTPLPTEAELAKSCNVSVGTVRKAVEKLVEEGVLVKQQGRGTFLKQPNFDSSLLRFFKYRNAQNLTLLPIGEVKNITVVAAIPDINRKLVLSLKEKLIYIERVRKIEEKVMLSEKIWLPESLFHPLLKFSVQEFGNLLYPFYYEHCQQFVVSATEQLFFIKSYQDNYLKNQVEESLVRICRIAKNLKGKPIEYRESMGLAEDFYYEVNIN